MFLAKFLDIFIVSGNATAEVKIMEIIIVASMGHSIDFGVNLTS